MKKLTQLENQFSKKQILSKNKTQDIKGGQRFITRKHIRMVRKLARLHLRGFSPVVSEHNGKYCIEW